MNDERWSWVAFFILTHLVAVGAGISFADALRQRRENQKKERSR